MSTKAIARATVGLIVIIIVLAAGLISVSYYSARPVGVTTGATTARTASLPDFVKSATFVYEGGHEFQYLDPAIMYYGWDSTITNNVYEMLLWLNGNSSTELIPWLAESYQKLSPTQYQFKLRQNITFQDGTPFNARAVWFSYNRVLMIDGSSPSGAHGTQAAWIVQQMLEPSSLFSYLTPNQPYDAAWVQKVLALKFVEILDPYTINMNIKTPTTQFEALLSTQWGPNQILSPSFVVSHDFPSACATSDCPADTINYTAYFDHIAGHGDVSMNYLVLPTNGAKAGTGPYYIDRVDPTTYEVVLKANPNYWGGPKNWNGPPISVSIKTIDSRYVPSLSTRLLDLEAGTATAIEVGSPDIYSVADRAQWLTYGKFVSIIPGATLLGPYPTAITDWFQFITNVTDTSGHILKFQPFADIRFRLAVADSVNFTDANININNKLGQVAGSLIPPGMAPQGAYNPAIKPIYSFNLTKVAQLLLDAQAHPLQKFVDMNGHPYASGTIDNSFGPDKPQSIGMYVGEADALDQKILTVIAAHINAISVNDSLGLTFSVIPVPQGQQYTLADQHIIYLFLAGWAADYNYIDDYLSIALPSGYTGAQGNYNYTDLTALYYKALDADSRGDVQGVLQAMYDMETLYNQKVLYVWSIYEVNYKVTSAYVQGYFWNSGDATSDYDTSYFASVSYATS